MLRKKFENIYTKFNTYYHEGSDEQKLKSENSTEVLLKGQGENHFEKAAYLSMILRFYICGQETEKSAFGLVTSIKE